MKQARIAIFASGKGTNAEKIILHFSANPTIKVCLILTNNATAGVLDVAAKYNIPAASFTRDEFYNTSSVLQQLEKYQISHIVLAGFLWLVPKQLVSTYPNRIVNIHPALLPSHGGKGMYGIHVHKAVKEAAESVTGITIHLVNENYDEGSFIHQEKIMIQPADSIETIASKVQALEHTYYPIIIEKWIRNSYFEMVE